MGLAGATTFRRERGSTVVATLRAEENLAVTDPAYGEVAGGKSAVVLSTHHQDTARVAVKLGRR
jgi:hypothetical protein